MITLFGIGNKNCSCDLLYSEFLQNFIKTNPQTKEKYKKRKRKWCAKNTTTKHQDIDFLPPFFPKRTTGTKIHQRVLNKRKQCNKFLKQRWRHSILSRQINVVVDTMNQENEINLYKEGSCGWSYKNYNDNES